MFLFHRPKSTPASLLVDMCVTKLYFEQTVSGWYNRRIGDKVVTVDC